MNYDDRLDRYKANLENSIEVTKKTIEEISQSDEKGNLEFWEASLENLEYQYDNLEASFLMNTIWHISYATYYDIQNVQEYLEETVGIDLRANGLDKNSYGLHNLEEFRQKVIDLAGITIDVPSPVEANNTYNSIVNSDMSPEEKRDQILKCECLSGLQLGGFSYENGLNNVGVPNLSGLQNSIREGDALSIFYENGLEKSNTK